MICKYFEWVIGNFMFVNNYGIFLICKLKIEIIN